MTYTLLGIDYANGTRTSKRRFKPQSNLTMSDLDRIRSREYKRLCSRHPEAKPDDLAAMLLYRDDALP